MLLNEIFVALRTVVRPGFLSENRRASAAHILSSMIKKLLLLAAVALCVGLSVAHGQTTSTAVPIPPPVPALPPLPAPPLRPVARPLPRPDVAAIQRLTPRVEIWRPNADRPQIPARRGKRTDYAFVTGTEPVTVRLQFDPRVAGARVVVIAANGFTFNPPQQVLTVSSRGDCVLTGQLAEGAPRGHFVAYCGMIQTIVPLARTSMAGVEAEEVRTGGRP